MSALSILLVHGDAEARLLADAEFALQSVLPDTEITVQRVWAPRVDWLTAESPPPPAALRSRGILADIDARTLLREPHDVVIFSLWPSVAVPALEHRDGGVFLAHRDVAANWSARQAAWIAEECVNVAPLSASRAARSLEPVVLDLQERGQTVAVTMTFRHVAEPPSDQDTGETPSLLQLTRSSNLEVARLSQRTGCFVLDLDRPLAAEGGRCLQADCFGGIGQAQDLALEELAALVFDMLPDRFAIQGAE